MSETVEVAGQATEAPRRRGRPKGARDAKPRKRRNDGLVGQVLDATPRTPPIAAVPAAPTSSPDAQLPLSPTATAPIAIDTAALPPDSLEDVRRKLKAEADLKVAQAARAERENAVAAGLLIGRQDVDSMLAKRASLLQRSLLTLPDRVADELALESDPRRIRVRLRSEIEALVRNYAGQDAEEARARAQQPADELGAET